MKVTRTESFIRTKTAGKVHPAGTILWQYAVEGTKEELAAYEEAQGSYFAKFDDKTPEFEGKPIYRSSQKLCAIGESINVNMKVSDSGARLNPVITAQEAELEQDTKNLNNRLEKGSKAAEIEYKAQMAAKYGVALA